MTRLQAYDHAAGPVIGRGISRVLVVSEKSAHAEISTRLTRYDAVKHRAETRRRRWYLKRVAAGTAYSGDLGAR